MSIFNKFSGYTLSEILITITLIGFLAALTLSTVGSSVQQRTRLAQFRTAYSKMTSAFKGITIDKARVYSCYLTPTADDIKEFGLSIDGLPSGSSTSGCADLERDFVRAMGAIRFCENNPISEGCIPQNYPVAQTCFNSEYSQSRAYVLDNSMIIITNKKSDGLKLFALDANGRKGPNKWGQDLFPFSMKISETKKVNNTVYVKATEILTPEDSCYYGVNTSIPLKDRANRTTGEMLKESAGISLKRLEANGGKL